MMSKKVRRLALFAACLFIAVIGIKHMSKTFAMDFTQQTLNGLPSSTDNTSLDKYLVNTPMCKIPKVDPYDSTIKKMVGKTGPRKCPQETGLTYQTGNLLKINWTLASNHKDEKIKHCTYMPLFRPNFTPTENNYVRYLEESEPFINSVEIKHEFVRANCYNNKEVVVYRNFHAFIQRNTSMDTVYRQRFLKHVRKDKVTEQLNVVMIGMDSVSRLSFGRQMVKTKKFLEDTLGAFDMAGYNKVADNTFINIVPMTLGKFAEEMPWDESQTDANFDNFDFIWKKYSQNGYRTFYAEDAPHIAIFDFLKAGFLIPPADHFNRPMSLVMELAEDLWSENHHCFQNRLETDIVLNYMFDFLDTYKDEPHFAFSFITRLSHDDVNSAGAADEPYYNFFRSLHDKDLLKNTVVFFFSDHGMRFGKIRETHIGKLEERLPFMYVVLPKWLQNHHQFLHSNLQINQHRLSTPFDVYQTLLDVLKFDGTKKMVDDESRGHSWFREIPNTRSCDRAGILPHWCTCLEHESISLQSEIVKRASNALLLEILKQLKDYRKICHDLTIRSVYGATRLVESDEVLKFITKHQKRTPQVPAFGDLTKVREDIQLVIETVPGNALFEGTVRLDTFRNSYMVVGDISRINVYGYQSQCIDVFKLKKFCQCKD